MVKAESGRIFVAFLATLLILALGSAVLYLSATINHRHYRLAQSGTLLVVERGRMLPLGFEPFSPDIPGLKEAYSPVPLPPGENLTSNEVYDDRADLDRSLFGLLASWARTRLDASDPDQFELAIAYVERAKLLPGLSEEQRQELRTLRADLAYKNGKRLLQEVVERLRRARQELQMALALGTSRPTDADRWLAEVERRLAALEPPAPAQESADGPPAPAGEQPPAPKMPASPAPGGADAPRWRL